jgi:SAM-dependent methyltransferase
MGPRTALEDGPVIRSRPADLAPPPEFDAYADEYARLLQDPLRDWFAPRSAFFFERKWILIRDFFRRAGITTSGRSWLDVGCGRGDLLSIGRGAFAEVAGCDPSSRMLDGCSDLPVRLQESAELLPFPDNAFDLVTAVCVYHHVKPALRTALTREIARVLRPGGFACIIEHNPFNPVTRMIVSRTPVDSDAHLLSDRFAQHLLRGAGMEPAATHFFLFVPQRLYRRLARLEDLARRLPVGGQYAVFGQKPT